MNVNYYLTVTVYLSRLHSDYQCAGIGLPQHRRELSLLFSGKRDKADEMIYLHHQRNIRFIEQGGIIQRSLVLDALIPFFDDNFDDVIEILIEDS